MLKIRLLGFKWTQLAQQQVPKIGTPAQMVQDLICGSLSKFEFNSSNLTTGISSRSLFESRNLSNVLCTTFVFYSRQITKLSLHCLVTCYLPAVIFKSFIKITIQNTMKTTVQTTLSNLDSIERFQKKKKLLNVKYCSIYCYHCNHYCTFIVFLLTLRNETNPVFAQAITKSNANLY